MDKASSDQAGDSQATSSTVTFIPSRSPTPEDIFLKDPPMMSSQPTAKQMHERLNHNISQLLQRFENLMATATAEKTSYTEVAAEANQLDVETEALIRAGEDLLSMTRTMKELWYYGKLDTLGENQQDIERSKKLEEDVRAVEKAVEEGTLEQLCPEEDKKKEKQLICLVRKY